MRNAWRSPGWGGVLIVSFTILAYLPALRGGFIWDDNAYVTQNPLLTAPDGLKRIWFSTHRQSQYFPLVYTTLRFERMVWGLNPMGYHVVNVVLHGMNALLVWAVLRRLAVPDAWLAAAVWAVHPINVESVAWVTELKNTQSTLFYLLAVLVWMKFADRETVRPWRFYALALLLFALALFSKTTACTLPAAMLLVLWLRKEPIGWRRSVQVAPFVVFGIGMGLLSVWWEAHLDNYSKESGLSFSGLERLLIATHALWFYAAKLGWPTGLTFSYARWEISPRDPLQYAWLIGCLLVALLLWWRRNALGRAPVAAVVFFVAALSPLVGFIPLYTFRYSFVADHYQYLACIGLIALAVGAGATIAQRAGQWGRDLGAVAAAALLLVLGMSTWQQTHVYKDPETLWRDTLAKNPNAWIAHNNLGNVLRNQGKLQEAKWHFEQTLQIKPDYVEAHSNLGFVLSLMGNAQEAAWHYEQAVRIKPEDAEVRNNLGNALLRLGKVQEAIGHYERALRIKPDDAETHYNLGVALEQAGQGQEAMEHYEQALRLKPGHAEAHNNLGIVLKNLGRVPEAIQHYEEALRIRPDYAEAHYNLGVALVRLGRVPEAVGHWEQALRIKPDYAKAHYNLGVALEQVGRVPEAMGHYEQALRINPDYVEAQNRLARLRTAQ